MRLAPGEVPADSLARLTDIHAPTGLLELVQPVGRERAAESHQSPIADSRTAKKKALETA